MYQADQAAKTLVNTLPSLRQSVVQLLGPEAFSGPGETLNRVWVAERAFHQPELLSRLNQLIHPAVGADYTQWAENHRPHHRYVLKEAALLFESGSWKQLDAVVEVFAPRTVRIERVRQRDPHRPVEEIESIMARQWPEAIKLSLATHILYNDGKEDIRPQVLALHERFMQ